MTWRAEGLRWATFKRPRWLTRYLLRALLEIEWLEGAR